MVRDAVLTYVAPFLGVLLLSVGISAGVLGTYSTFQQDTGLCSNPLLSVETPEATERLRQGSGEGGGPVLREFAFSDLSSAEQAAIEEALAAPGGGGEGAVEGPFPNRQAFVDGAVVTYEGTDYYVTLESANRCVEANPLLAPLGVVAMVLGLVGVFAPPLYRRYVRFERRQGEV